MIGKNELAEISYVGADNANEFAIPFKSWNPEDLIVFVIRQSDGVRLNLAITNDYTLPVKRNFLSLVAGAKEWLVAGNLTLGYTLFIQFDSEAYQPAQFYDIGSITPTRVQDSMDRLTMTMKAVNDKASRALQIEAGAGSSQLPPLVGNAGRILKVNDDEDGFDYGPDVQEIFDAKDEAQAAAISAGSSKDQAALSAGNAAASQTAAATSANNSYNYSQAASTSASNASTSELNTKSYEEEAERWAHYYAFEDIRSITAADSPYTVDYTQDENFLILIDTTAGPIVMNLPSLALMPNSSWKVGIVKTSEDANTITVNPFAGQTIKGLSSLTLDKTDIGIVFHDATPTNWHGDVLIVGSFGGGSGSGLPPGGDQGDYLEKQSNVEGDAIWKSGAFSGFSAQFNREISADNVRDMLLAIVNYSYLAPTVSLTASGSGTVREKGSTIGNSNLSAAVTKRSNPISRIRFMLNGGAIEDLNPPATDGSQTANYTWIGTMSDTSTFRVEVTDTEVAGTGPTTVVSNNVTFNFVYPYYYGCGLPALNAAGIGALTKYVINSTASVNRSFTAADDDVFYFAYPSAYPALTQIKDANNFETLATDTPAWTIRTVSITGLDGTPQSYRVYEFKNIQVANTTNFTFIR